MPAERPAWAATHVGTVRTLNEDRCLVGNWCSDGSSTSWHGVLSWERGWAAVTDGMGGHDAGDVASRIVLATIAELIGDTTSKSDVERMLETANLRLYEAMYGLSGSPGMGTTVVGVVLARSAVMVFNIGDSRAYSLVGHRLVQHSQDDTLRGPTAKMSPRNHALTQSLGGTVSRRPLQPHIKEFSLEDDDLLLVCSDGLTDMLDDDEIAGILIRDSGSPAEMLVAGALDTGGEDNVTAVVIGAATSRT